MTKPILSVLIDTYNHERYIEQTLVSVLEQDLSAEELEVVVVDDGSTDRTPEIIQKFAPRVRHVRKKNGGQASAFNAGFAESRGEIVALLDGDDWWAKGKLRRVVEALEEESNVGAVGHGYYEFHEETKEARARVPVRKSIVNIETKEGTREALLAWPFMLMGALTVRRSVLEWIMPLPEKMVFMADSPIQVAAMAKGAVILPEPLFYYRYHRQNLFAIDAKEKAKLRRRSEMTRLVYDEMYRMLVRRGLSRERVGALLVPAQEHQFTLHPPGRLDFFRFLVRQNYLHSPEQTWRFTALNYLTPFAALFYGYENERLMYEWRRSATERVERLYRWLVGARTGTGSKRVRKA